MKSKKRYKSASEFKKFLKENEPQKVKEEYKIIALGINKLSS